MTSPGRQTRTARKNSPEEPVMAEHQDEPDIRLTPRRVIDAPVQRVYAASTDPALLTRWLAPGDAGASRAVADVAVGGTFLIEMRGTDGQRWLARGTYREVEPLRRLVHTLRWEGSEVETWSPWRARADRVRPRQPRLVVRVPASGPGTAVGVPLHSTRPHRLRPLVTERTARGPSSPESRAAPGRPARPSRPSRHHPVHERLGRADRPRLRAQAPGARQASRHREHLVLAGRRHRLFLLYPSAPARLYARPRYR